MSEDVRYIFRLLLVSIGILALIVGSVCWLLSAECSAKSNAIGVPYSWGPIQGCIITLRDGSKIPLNQYRVID